MINEEKKFIFLHIPKTGGTSINTAVMSELRRSTNNLRHYNIRRHGLTKKDCDEYSIFAVLRNPLTRIASTYNHYMEVGENHAFNKKSYTFYEYLLNIKKYFDGALKPRPLGLRRAYRVENEDGETLFDSQHVETLKWWLETTDGKQANCHILRFERLNSDWEKFKSKILVSSKLEKLNAAKTSGEDYMKYYDKDSKKIIQQLYAEEFRNYEQEYNKP